MVTSIVNKKLLKTHPRKPQKQFFFNFVFLKVFLYSLIHLTVQGGSASGFHEGGGPHGPRGPSPPNWYVYNTWTYI